MAQPSVTFNDDTKRGSMRSSVARGAKGFKGGLKGAVKNSTALPGGAMKGVGNAAQFVAKGTASGTAKAAKLGVKSTLTGARLGAKGIGAGAKLGVKGIGTGAKLGVKGTLAGAKLGVKGTLATTKGAVGVGRLVAKGGVGLVTDFPGTTINLVGNTLKGAVGLPGTLTNLARRRVVRDNRLAWETRITSPVIKIDLHVECKNLPQKDSFALADAFAVVWAVPNGYVGTGVDSDRPSPLPSRQELEIGRTEVVRGSNSPRFEHTLRLDFLFQEEQTYLIRVYDEDLKYATDLREHDYLGGFVFTLGELMGSAGCTMARALGQGGRSQLYISGREISEAREIVALRFSAQEMPAVDGLDKNDPYFNIERLEEDGVTWETIFKSEVLMDDDNPTWALVRLPVPQLCHGDIFNQIKITLWDWNKFADDNALGFVETTVRNLVHGSEHGIPTLNIYREEKKMFRGSKQRKAGCLKVLKAHIVQIPSLLEFVCGGCEIDLTIAVDCSMANGEYTDETGLHFRSQLWLNDYQAAIHKVGVICESYNTRKEFNIWGFGGIIDEEEQDVFNIGDGVGIGANGLLDQYENFFGEHITHYPSEGANIKPILEKAMFKSIEQSQNRHCYSILCILTAGAVYDVQEAVDSLCTAAEDAPMSVVIIGVGLGNFEAFTNFFEDGSAKLQHSNGVPISRDICRFAAFSDFEESSSKVVAEALSAVPEQFVQSFVNNGIKPRPPIPAPDLERILRQSTRRSKKKKTKRSKSKYS
ncbi:Copine-1 [Seminavis robusta]|uniref:Copine-1 n=1 Tax=Seminavis robusta TaxID=568900 RepID=A0A9N8HAA3_9STRA|nr:Copine-1 [Seminavis robusta]|eukprot:Sro217_g089700.1 Copine-1 (758) ;mRNA; r:35504-38349